MNEQKNMTGYVLVDDDIINREPMRTLIRKEGVEGLGAVTALLLLLCNHPDATAKLSSLKPLSCQLRVSYPYLLHIIKDYRMFRLTEDGLSFRTPYMRKRRVAADGDVAVSLLEMPAAEQEAAERRACRRK